jgi:DNA-binding XRE family transcriptional regulator
MTDTVDERLDAMEAENAQLRGAIYALERGVACHRQINLRRPENADLGLIVARVLRDGEERMPDAALKMIAPVLVQQREKLGVSREALAARSGVPLATLVSIEVAEPGASWDAMHRVAFMLGIDLSERFVRPVTNRYVGGKVA